jgi:hypothetical protein
LTDGISIPDTETRESATTKESKIRQPSWKKTNPMCARQVTNSSIVKRLVKT